MSQVKQTAEEVRDSVTGHDEMAIAQHFGRTFMDLMENDPLTWGRSLVFVTKRREGLNDDDARNFALDMPFKVINEEYFAEPTADSDEETEEVESGKGEPQDAEQPRVSLLPSAI